MVAKGTQLFFGEPRSVTGERLSGGLFQPYTRVRRRAMESFVNRHQTAICKQSRRDEVCIDPANTAAPKLPAFHQIQRFFVSGLGRFREFCEISPRKFTQHEGMH